MQTIECAVGVDAKGSAEVEVRPSLRWVATRRLTSRGKGSPWASGYLSATHTPSLRPSNLTDEDILHSEIKPAFGSAKQKLRWKRLQRLAAEQRRIDLNISAAITLQRNTADTGMTVPSHTLMDKYTGEQSESMPAIYYGDVTRTTEADTFDCAISQNALSDPSKTFTRSDKVLPPCYFSHCVQSIAEKDGKLDEMVPIPIPDAAEVRIPTGPPSPGIQESVLHAPPSSEQMRKSSMTFANPCLTMHPL